MRDCVKKIRQPMTRPASFYCGNGGHSLVEMAVVVAMISILLAVGTLAFREYSTRYSSEAQTRLLFSELLKARANAICQRRGTRVKVYADRFEVYSSQADGGTVSPPQTHGLSFTVTSNGEGWGSGLNVDFNESGMSTIDWCSICLDSTAGSGAVDSVVISGTRLSIGKRDKGDDCTAANITIK